MRPSSRRGTSSVTGMTDNGDDLLAHVWFCTIEELHDTMHSSENPQARNEAADILLRYFASLAQSINEPFIPKQRPDISLDHEGDEDD